MAASGTRPRTRKQAKSLARKLLKAIRRLRPMTATPLVFYGRGEKGPILHRPKANECQSHLGQEAGQASSFHQPTRAWGPFLPQRAVAGRRPQVSALATGRESPFVGSLI